MNAVRFLFAFGAAGFAAALASGGCLVVSDTKSSTSSGGGSTANGGPSTSAASGMGGGMGTTNATTGSGMGQGGATSTAGVTASSSSGMCMDQAGCQKCGACIGQCGTPINPATNNLCCESYDKYVAMFDCACGQDGMSGACGSKCSKTCLNQGMDSPGCMPCLAAALSGTCYNQYKSCSTD